jgi:hypothetical protein
MCITQSCCSICITTEVKNKINLLEVEKKRCALKVFNILSQENPEMVWEAIAEVTSQATRIGAASMYRIQKYMNTNNYKLSSLEVFPKIS